MHPQRVGRGRRRQLPHRVVVGVERQGDERLEPAGLVLQGPRPQHVVDALVGGLDVPVEHGHVRAHAEPVRGPVDVQVAVGAAFVVANLAADALREHLGPSARQRVEPGLHQFAQHLLVGPAVDVREERDLHRREALEMHVGADALEPPQQLQVVVERQVRVQTVDHVYLGQGLVLPRPQLVPHLLQGQGVGTVVAGLQAGERAEQAACDADVGRLDADVVVEERPARVPPLALAVGQPTQRQQVGAGEQPHAVFVAQPHPVVELLGDIEQPSCGKARRRGRGDCETLHGNIVRRSARPRQPTRPPGVHVRFVRGMPLGG